MREIVLDTETTGFDHQGDDRIVEIGCIELVNQMATEATYHQYVNPQRTMPIQAFDVHGLSEEFLSGHPVFADIVDDFIDFLGDAQLIIHNAEFDMGFINAELKRLGRDPIPMDRAVDTVRIARRKYPGAPASLDALCKRFQIDNSDRALHGALKDSRLLADVYLELIGGRQRGLELAGPAAQGAAKEDKTSQHQAREQRQFSPSSEELAAHKDFIAGLNEPVWDD